MRRQADKEHKVRARVRARVRVRRGRFMSNEPVTECHGTRHLIYKVWVRARAGARIRVKVKVRVKRVGNG